MEIFVKLKQSREEIGINGCAIDVGFAFLNSCVGVKKEAAPIADRLNADRENSQLVGTGYKLVFLAATYKNLGDREKAFSLYRFLHRPSRPKPVQYHQSQSSQP
ncbi:hypothetical protein [Microcoleus sp. LEGE 07076]|uniref:hypothetical protein n=1 Tax=Microcoleus sp. LEGE 07076 TaxID=915322 RepID=UPI001D1553FC|nr:hypothetical protein [Microcoleus sp. LEGE 07076]